MYKELYGFTTYPFVLTPDPQFLYPSKNYTDCLFHVLYGLERGSELLVLTGETGTGKTFLLNTLVEKLNTKAHIAFLFYSELSYIDILKCISHDFNLETERQSEEELLVNLKRFLLNCAMKNEKVILIIDEAQNLLDDVLEDLQFLRNLENSVKKLLQIILSGHLELENTLNLPKLSQIRQIIGVHCRLIPMSYSETRRYIARRLEVAGSNTAIFTPKAIREIFVGSQGIPRAINVICDLALLSGFINEEHEIGRATIRKVTQEFSLYTPAKRTSRQPHQKRATNGGHASGFMRPSRLAIVAGITVFSLLGTAVVLQSSLVSRKLSEYMTTGVSPLAALPYSPGVREQPILPYSPGVREQPILPYSPGVREQSKRVQWVQTTLAYQLPTGEPLAVSLPALQHTPESGPVEVTLDASDSTPIWLKFDPQTLTLSGIAPLTETGKIYHLTFRARTADGFESSLQVALTLIPLTVPR